MTTEGYLIDKEVVKQTLQDLSEISLALRAAGIAEGQYYFHISEDGIILQFPEEN